MMKQSTSVLGMVRPSSFYDDPATAESNAFQGGSDEPAEVLLEKALIEFDQAVSDIQSKGIEVVVVEDTVPGDKPNAIFPNNWFSTHADGTVVLYSMAAPTRREERNIPMVEALEKEGYEVPEIIDMTFYEEQGQFLEGTGSLILDRVNRIAYAGLSSRTDAELVRTFGYELGYEIFTFETADQDGQPIYHTNVMMAIGTGFALVCFDAVKEDHARTELNDMLTQWGLEVISISFEQMNAFAGNVLEVESSDGKRHLLISRSGLNSLDAGQKEIIKKYAEFLPVDIPTIQKVGGGGIRCMVAEIFLKK